MSPAAVNIKQLADNKEEMIALYSTNGVTKPRTNYGHGYHHHRLLVIVLLR